jgi:hypothetical protein
MRRWKKHAPTVEEHKRLWALIGLSVELHREIAKAITDIFPVSYADKFAHLTFSKSPLSALFGWLSSELDNFAARKEGEIGSLNGSGIDWALHYDHRNLVPFVDRLRALVADAANAAPADRFGK